MPVVPEILRGKVQVLVELYRKRRELQRLNLALEEANAELAARSAASSSAQRESARSPTSNSASANESLKAEVRERKRVQAALREADRRKEEFLAVLSHELRNPLAAVDAAVSSSSSKNLPIHSSWARDVLSRQTAHLDD